MAVHTIFDIVPEAEQLLGEQPKTYTATNIRPRHVIPKLGKLYIMVGFPGSGKTTYIEHFLFPKGVIRVSHDYIKEMLTGTYNVGRTKLYHTVEDGTILAALHLGWNVVVDRTCLNRKTRERFVKLGKEAGASEIIAVVMVTPLSVCRQRNLNPDRLEKNHYVGADVFDSLAKTWEEVAVDEGFTDIQRVDMAAVRLDGGCDCV